MALRLPGYGIREDRAVRYHSNRDGVALNYEIVSSTVSTYRRDSNIEEDWSEDIEKDYTSRKEDM